MNNKVYMRAAAVMGDPAFTAMVQEAKKAAGQFPDMDLAPDTGIVACVCLAMKPDAPNFVPLAKKIEIEQVWEFNPELHYRLLQLVDAAWKIITTFFPLDTYKLPTTELWQWVIWCITDEECPEPQKSTFPVFHPFDPDQVLIQAETLGCRTV
jgi:hypothetical protein